MLDSVKQNMVSGFHPSIDGSLRRDHRLDAEVHTPCGTLDRTETGECPPECTRGSIRKNTRDRQAQIVQDAPLDRFEELRGGSNRKNPLSCARKLQL